MKWALMGNRLMWSRKYRLHFTICHRNIPNAARELEKTDIKKVSIMIVMHLIPLFSETSIEYQSIGI